MKRHIQRWWSPRLNKNMDIAVYGHYGFALLMFPSAGSDYLEYERFHMLETIRPAIEAGKLKVYSINSINGESWLNSKMSGRAKIVRHMQYNGYIAEEVVPYIWNDCNSKVPIITTGVSLGAFHAANSIFRRPDLFSGVVAMSGVYDLSMYTGGYNDEDVYFNNPYWYMKNIGESAPLHQLRQKKHLHFVTGSGSYESPQATHDICNILDSKGIPNTRDIWGRDMPHDWPTWRRMLPHYVNNVL